MEEETWRLCSEQTSLLKNDYFYLTGGYKSTVQIEQLATWLLVRVSEGYACHIYSELSQIVDFKCCKASYKDFQEFFCDFRLGLALAHGGKINQMKRWCPPLIFKFCVILCKLLVKQSTSASWHSCYLSNTTRGGRLTPAFWRARGTVPCELGKLMVLSPSLRVSPSSGSGREGKLPLQGFFFIQAPNGLGDASPHCWDHPLHSF